LHICRTPASKGWRIVYLLTACTTWYGLHVWAATVSTHAFGRYEILLQEGMPVATGEILGTVRRQTGMPEYPLVLRRQKGALELSILGPSNRPIRLASTPFPGRRRAGTAPARFIVERSARQDEALILQVRQANAPGQASLMVDLRNLGHMLEGHR
jgi:hypothetical protein